MLASSEDLDRLDALARAPAQPVREIGLPHPGIVQVALPHGLFDHVQ
jgi:hypothetical protein